MNCDCCDELIFDPEEQKLHVFSVDGKWITTDTKPQVVMIIERYGEDLDERGGEE